MLLIFFLARKANCEVKCRNVDRPIEQKKKKRDSKARRASLQSQPAVSAYPIGSTSRLPFATRRAGYAAAADGVSPENFLLRKLFSSNESRSVNDVSLRRLCRTTDEIFLASY